MNIRHTQLNSYACSGLGKEFDILLESFDFRTESSVFRAPYISAPVLTEKDVDILFFRLFNFTGLKKAILSSMRFF
jgi:hypothetical protein